MSLEETVTQESTEVTETTEETTNEAIETDQSTEVTEATEEATETKSTETTSEESTDTTEDAGDAEYFFNGQQVQVEVPEDLRENLSSAGIDVDSVVKELYGKEGDFTLSDKTRAPLDEKFGKVVVDTFLNAVKSQNEGILKGATEAQNAANEADKQAVEWSNELVGGEESWGALEEWATGSLSEEEIQSFNRAMASGDKWMQEIAINTLASRMKEDTGDVNASLISGDSTSTESGGTALSASEYINEMTSPAFRDLKGQDKVNAQNQLDARRRAGIKKGI